MTIKPPGFFQGTEMPTEGWWETLWPDPAGVLASVGIGPDMAVIDLCCGDGWFTRPLAKIARHVVAIDIDQKLLEQARARFAKYRLMNCVFVPGDAYELASLAAVPADFVFMANAFHGVPDQPRLARAVCASLRRSGHFAIVNWHQRRREETKVLGVPRGPRDDLRMSPEMTIKAVEGSGLEFVRLIEIPPHHYGAVFLKSGP
jgi:SAM-dependent methyltransferase